MASPFTDGPKLNLKINGTVGLANRQPPITTAEFDSEIIGYDDPSSNADLKITLKVWFEKKDPPLSPTGKTASFVKAWCTTPMTSVRPGYDDGDFAAFKRIVLQEANSFWNGKMWLFTPSKYDGLDWFRAPLMHSVRPNLHCLFNAVEATSSSQAHLTIKCWHLQSGTDCVSYGSFSDEYDNYDVVDHAYDVTTDVGTGPTKIPSGTVLPKQMTVWHEMGHAIGMKHSATTVTGCSAAQNGCYGNFAAAEPWMARNIMGLGKEITAYNGKPWAERMVQHTIGTTTEADWNTWTARPIPQTGP